MENIDVVKGIYESLAKGDVAAVVAVLDPKVEWWFAEGHPFSNGHALIGPDEVVGKAFARLAAETDGFSVIPGNFIAGGESVVVEGRYRGLWKATGQSFDTQVAHVWDLRDGKIVRCQQYVDTAQFQRVSAA